jgi:NADH:ubiquinone oxidoreductase subunit C
LTLTLDVADIIKSCLQLRDTFLFDTLIDLSGVDYLTYGTNLPLPKYLSLIQSLAVLHQHKL